MTKTRISSYISLCEFCEYRWSCKDKNFTDSEFECKDGGPFLREFYD